MQCHTKRSLREWVRRAIIGKDWPSFKRAVIFTAPVVLVSMAAFFLWESYRYKDVPFSFFSLGSASKQVKVYSKVLRVRGARTSWYMVFYLKSEHHGLGPGLERGGEYIYILPSGLNLHTLVFDPQADTLDIDDKHYQLGEGRAFLIAHGYKRQIPVADERYYEVIKVGEGERGWQLDIGKAIRTIREDFPLVDQFCQDPRALYGPNE